MIGRSEAPATRPERGQSLGLVGVVDQAWDHHQAIGPGFGSRPGDGNGLGVEAAATVISTGLFAGCGFGGLQDLQLLVEFQHGAFTERPAFTMRPSQPASICRPKVKRSVIGAIKPALCVEFGRHRR